MQAVRIRTHSDEGKRRGSPLVVVFAATFNHEQFSLATIDRGKRQDWAQLRRVDLDNREVMEKVLLAARAPTLQAEHWR